ncbi:MAG: L,D-transpeptidase family protein [Planctomycetes bacterium]|nr:L,D-transpeptidase family protein [Planctomycetota bacterium]
MASRRSRRGKKSGGKGWLMIVAAILIAAGAGGFFAFGGSGDGETTDASISDLIPGMDDDTPEVGDQQGGGDTQSLAGIESMLQDISINIQSTTDQEREKALRDGYGRLATLLESPLPMEERSRAIELFHSITDELFLSTTHNEFCDNYVVKRNDSYDKIASRHHISTNLLYDLNSRPRGATMLHLNDNLKVPKGDPQLVIRKRDFTCSLYFGKFMVRQYIIAHGRNNNTPVGMTSIASMTIDPEKSAQGPNDPRGEMKLRWIGLAEYADHRTGFGLHGTQYPDSIPGMTSAGCIRMHDDNVIELYDIVRIGNKVEIKP